MMGKMFIAALFIMHFINTLGQVSVMTYNIRYNNPNDKENCWENRKEEVVNMIRYYQPDILGIQEGLFNQVEYLSGDLKSFNYVGVGRDDGKKKGEYAAIFYNTEKYAVIETKTYWLSETPGKVSVGWDASMERITTYGVFTNKDANDTLYVFNCHYDHIGEKARQKSSELIVSLIHKKGLLDKNVIVMGDLNSAPADKPVRILSALLKDSYSTKGISPYGPVGTYNGFDVSRTPKERIDYIFTINTEVKRYRSIDDRRENNLYLSDHLPVFVSLQMKK